MSDKKKLIAFDPDEFVLTKQDVLKILDRIENRWKQNKKDNLPLLMELKGAKFYFRIKSEESIRELWGEILNEFNEIMIENSLSIAKNNDESWADTFQKIKEKK